MVTTKPKPARSFSIAILLLGSRTVFSLSLKVSQSRTIDIPFTEKLPTSTKRESLLKTAFQNVVESTDFFDLTNENTCSVPPFGPDVRVHFGSGRGDQKDFLLTVENAGATDFGWICTKFYESKDFFDGMIDTSHLRSAVIDHYNNLPADPGLPADPSDKPEINDRFQKMFHGKSILRDLELNGYAVIDNAPITSQEDSRRVSRYLKETAGQGENVRTDQVHFLTKDQAYENGLEVQFDVLMTMASYLNDHFQFRESCHSPISPATLEKPLTIPRTIQLAEYGKGGFYKAHSDNSMQVDKIRSNFRHLTCILYTNDNWNAEDGGALRLYPGSRDFMSPDEAIHRAIAPVDILPRNGRMILFESCLVHSVEKVLTDRLRRALTIWINRPNDSGVKGEAYF